MRRIIALPVAIAAIATAATPATSPQATPALTPAELARARELESLVKAADALLEEFGRADAAPDTALPQAEKERRVRILINRYELLLRENPDHPETLLLYGKFLRRVGERDLAYKVFQRADRADPALAVVKHQLGAHLAENGEFAAAYPLLARTVALAPAEPRYHYDFAEFLAAAAESGDLPDSREVRDRLMLTHFDTAAQLKPGEAGYRWRAAEARYDVRTPDAAEALARWDALDKAATGETEKEVISLHRARWLIALNRPGEARKLIMVSRSPQLHTTRGRLLDMLLKKEPGLTDPFPERRR